MKDLKQVESELTTLLSNDKRSWTEIYLLLKEVQDEALYEPSFSSFTQWVKAFSMDNHIHESILWNRMKAGKVYASYKNIKEQKGENVPDISDISVSPDSLVLLDKIQKANPNIASELTEKVMQNELSRADLREAYKNIKESKGIKKVSTNPHSKSWAESERKEEIKKDKEQLPTIKNIKAEDIVYCLSKGVDWYTKPKERMFTKFKSKGQYEPVYKAIPEFAVYTGTSTLSRRIDCLCVENHSTSNLWEVHLHGIEIKVDKHDLINDHKFTEYAEFVDYLWIAIPHTLVDVAKTNIPKQIGIVTFEYNEEQKLVPKIERTATKVNPQQRETTLASLVIRNIR